MTVNSLSPICRPRLLLDGALEGFTGEIRIGLRNLRDERIRIKGDGSDKSVEIAVGEIGVLLLETARKSEKLPGNGE